MSIEYLTAEQAADRLNINEQTVRRYIRSGHLKAAKVGRKYIITSDNLLAFIRTLEAEQKGEKWWKCLPPYILIFRNNVALQANS